MPLNILSKNRNFFFRLLLYILTKLSFTDWKPRSASRHACYAAAPLQGSGWTQVLLPSTSKGLSPCSDLGSASVSQLLAELSVLLQSPQARCPAGSPSYKRRKREALGIRESFSSSQQQKAPLAMDLEDYALCHITNSLLCFKRKRGTANKKRQIIAWCSLWFFLMWCLWLCEETREQPTVTAQEKPHTISTIFHLFESSAFDSIYCWLNQDINSLTDSYKISSGKQVFLPSLMTWTLNYKMDRDRHSKTILSNTTARTVISCNYAFKLYSCNEYRALGPHHLLW